MEAEVLAPVVVEANTLPNHETKVAIVAPAAAGAMAVAGGFHHCQLVYSEAILVNYPNSVKLEFLQGDARFHLKFIYNLLAGEAVVFRTLV